MTRVFEQRIVDALDKRIAQNLTRRELVTSGFSTKRFITPSSDFCNFASNDYLGLAGDNELILAFQEGAERFGVGSGASPLVTGHYSAHQMLVESLTDWLGYEDAILFSSGFAANQALLLSILHKDDLLIQDKLNHASLIEAGQMSAAKMVRFRHNDIQHLKTKLSDTQNNVVVTEGVFSMDGDVAPLSDIQSVIASQRDLLIVDDAHGVGVLGRNGKGSQEYWGVRPDVLVVTFGKAFGGSGAAILCSSHVADYLRQFARHYIYSTSLPPAIAFAMVKSISLIQRDTWRREKLQALSSSFHEALSDFPQVKVTMTPIKPIVVGSVERALKLSETLKQHGIWATAIRPPTVPAGEARIRITLSVHHPQEEVAHLCKLLAAELNQLRS